VFLVQYKGLVYDLQASIKEASLFESKHALGDVSSLMQKLEAVLQISRDWQLDSSLLAQAERLILKMEVSLDLNTDTEALRRVLPLVTQAALRDQCPAA
jgi:hypothetical protein